MTACPAEAELSQFVIRGLPATAAASVENHLADCTECRNLVFALASGSGAGEVGEIADLSATERIGRFELIDLIGRGGMGAVYRARDPELDRTVAIKIRHLRSRLDVDHEDRLRREAQALARLADPNVVGVFESGVANGKPFVVMEYVAGATLEAWMKTTHDVPAVLAMLAQAGRGLAAAHAVGLVHRDFKPSNVLVSTVGVAKVGDFGLVRLDGEAAPRGQPNVDAAAMVLTLTGALLGTPAYMAPEQLDGDAATEASDQFSFCVTLYEALYRKRPFAGATIGHLRADMERTLVLPSTPRVPPAIRALLLRGLSVVPAKRNPSMAYVVAALAHRPARRLPWVLGATALVAGTAVVVGLQTTPAADPCAGAEADLSGIWDAPTKAAIRSRLLATQVPYAADAWGGVEKTLDAYASSWTQARRAACEATRVHAEQSEQVLALREQCLGDRTTELRLLTASLAKADAELVGRSVQAAGRLSPVGPCADVRALVEAAPSGPPSGRARLDQLRGQLAESKNESSMGRVKASITILDGVIAAARRENYAGVEAEAMIIQGRLKFIIDGDAKAAEKQLKQALLVADRGHDDYLRARAYVVLVMLVGGAQTRLDDAEELFQQGLATVGRLSSGENLEAQLLGNRGQQLTLQGKFAEADAMLRKAVTILRRTQGPEHPEIAIALAALAELEMRTGASREAYQHALEGYEMDKRLFGPHHPETAKSQFNLGHILIEQGKYDAAGETLASVVSVLEAALGPEHIDLANAVDELGIVRQHQGRLEDALALHRRSLALREKTLGPEAYETGISLDNLGAVLQALGRPAEALPYHRRALAITEATLGPETAEAAESHRQIAGALRELGKPREAMAELELAIGLIEKALGPEHADLADNLHALGALLLDLKRPAQAVRHLERAVKVQDPSGDPAVAAEIRFALARALWGSGDKDRARAIAEEARAAMDGKDRATVEAWLAAPK